MIFVYSGGKLVAEYSAKPPPQNPTTKYVATDTLQSVRAITNQDGEVISRRDFLPFGQEIPNADQPGQSASLRTSALKYGSDDVRQKFTGYQKDEESGLDFAEARMYNNRHARFTAVDPLLASGKSANPQTFNRYVYVLNSPLNLTDPSGLQAGDYVGDIFWNGNVNNPFLSYREKGYERYSGPTFDSDRSDGYRYRISRNGITQLGNTKDLLSEDRILQSLMGGLPRQLAIFQRGYPYPNPNGDPIGYELSRVNEAFNFIGHGIKHKVYDGAPDYAKFQWATPVFAVEFSMTRTLTSLQEVAEWISKRLQIYALLIRLEHSNRYQHCL